MIPMLIFVGCIFMCFYIILNSSKQKKLKDQQAQEEAQRHATELIRVAKKQKMEQETIQKYLEMPEYKELIRNAIKYMDANMCGADSHYQYVCKYIREISGDYFISNVESDSCVRVLPGDYQITKFYSNNIKISNPEQFLEAVYRGLQAYYNTNGKAIITKGGMLCGEYIEIKWPNPNYVPTREL